MSDPVAERCSRCGVKFRTPAVNNSATPWPPLCLYCGCAEFGVDPYEEFSGDDYR